MRRLRDPRARAAATRRGVAREGSATVFRLADVGGFTESGLTLDLAYIEDAVPRDVYAVPAKSVSSFPVPDGATWDELRITVRDTAIVADLRGTSREFGTEELGFAGRGRPSLAVVLRVRQRRRPNAGPGTPPSPTRMPSRSASK